ncbi:hypothetical protein PPL_02410 [Heterostelium album PN500]|uniref:RING-type domain-containing protein n=1 Tax=Heterostelium pallidum (strain ATCC 26659 / Pp 5 / PN500) TaxID=670386 RepID=D3AZM8_HETP5|nr:hypothetical protein PPL_02410 [Heterostelium album PN500]EFA85407.1 hypothetical protein PPL_02410 [Heterostelium album PN500]|eukprot:XP_020437516.1 hypothetical protein PPL_02410 [Heterostelium album PN500]
MEIESNMDYSIQCPECQLDIHSTLFQEHFNRCIGEDENIEQEQQQQEQQQQQQQQQQQSSDNNEDNDQITDNGNGNGSGVIGNLVNMIMSISGVVNNNNVNNSNNDEDDEDMMEIDNKNYDNDEFEEYDEDAFNRTYESNATSPSSTTTTTTTTTTTNNNNSNSNNNEEIAAKDRYTIINVDEGDPVTMDGASSFVLMSNGEFDEEYKSLQLVHQLMEQDRLEKLAKEEEENKRLVLEMLEQERLLHEQSVKESSKDLITQCIKCQKIEEKVEDIIFLDCSHVYCKSCLYSYIMNKINKKDVLSIKCRQCKISDPDATLTSSDIKQVLSDKEYQVYEDASLDEVVTKNKNFTKCPSCNIFMESIVNYGNGKKDGKEYDDNGNELSQEAIRHKNKCRLRCYSCSTFHYECCKKKLVNKWNSSRISFGFMKCALCSQNIVHESLKDELDPILELYDKIKTKGIQRLVSYGPEKGVDLKDPKCKWYKNEELYVMERLSYFPCFKCKKPYFGGEKACGENNVDFKAEELLCGGCSCDGKDNCEKHGKDYIEYKCKFCCNTSVFFCWGKTHFCDDCHKKSTEMVRTPRADLPKCTCGNIHPLNGEEHCYGCSICRINQA